MVASTGRESSAKLGAEALLDAAERLFLERGYANVSMQQIAEAAGFTKGATYYHFQSKEDLFLEVSKRLTLNLRDQLLAAFDEPGTFEEQLRRSTRMVRDSFAGDMNRWWSDAAVVFSKETKEAFLEQTFGVSDPSMLLVPVFERAAEQGIVLNLSPAAASRIYLGLTTAGLDNEKHRWVPTCADDEAHERVIDEIVTVFLYGVQGTRPLPD